jgi:hypothetical protein
LVEFARSILQAHLTALKNLSAVIYLFTEVDREYYERSKTKGTEGPLFGLDIGPGDQE